MAELDRIAAALQRQRRNIDDLLEQTSARSTETAELVNKIEDLRRRSEATLRRFEITADPSEPNDSE